MLHLKILFFLMLTGGDGVSTTPQRIAPAQRLTKIPDQYKAPVRTSGFVYLRDTSTVIISSSKSITLQSGNHFLNVESQSTSFDTIVIEPSPSQKRKEPAIGWINIIE
jgi:hypothetical protein